MHPSTIAVVQDFIARQTESHVGSTEPGVRGKVVNYDGSVAQIGYKLHTSAEEFKMVDDVFKKIVDFKGTPMLEIARRYWDDPDFAEQQRREIAQRKAGRGRR